MVKKLLKYEFKSVSKILVPLLLVVFALAILLSVMLNINIRRISESETGGNLFMVATGVFMFFAAIAIIASSVVLVVMLLHRYYKNFFSDEAYLTFTLPVKTHELLLTKYISGFVWMAAGTIVMVVSVLLIATVGTAQSGEIINRSVFSGIGELYALVSDNVGAANTVILIIEYTLLIIVKAIYNLSLYYLSITVGSIIAKKHKIFASIGMYFGISAILSIFTSQFGVFSIFGLSNIQTSDDIVSFFKTSFWICLIIYLAIAVGLYFFNHYLLSKKLNLE